MEGNLIIDELTTFLKTQEMSKQTKLACEEIIEELKVEKAEVLRDRVWELILGSQETRFINLDSTIFSNLWWKMLPCVLVHGGGVHQRTWSMFIAKHNAFVSTKRPGPCEAKLENELVHKKFLFIYSRVFLL